MTNRKTKKVFWFLVIEYFICHFCLQKYSDQTCLITHLSSCHLKQSNKKLEDNHRLPRLTKTDRELLQRNVF